jgi:hypothetical protein
MKGKIDASGWFTRNETDQYCPLDSVNENEARCGDWCPLFGEPSEPDPQGKIQLQICQGRVLYFDEFEDER